jgi:hypothetical protein
MKSKRIAVGVVLGVVVATFISVPFNPAFAQLVQTVPMIRFDGGPLPPWAQGTLRRDEFGVTMRIHTHVGGELVELTVPQGTNWKPGDVITNWFVNFNDPSACTDPCDLDDILAELDPVPPGNAGLHFATGHVTTSGKWSSSASLAEEDDTRMLFGVPLLEADDAEIHVIVRSHGPATTLTTDELLDALSMVNGGCLNAFPPPALGPNICGDPQAVVFPAP